MKCFFLLFLIMTSCICSAQAWIRADEHWDPSDPAKRIVDEVRLSEENWTLSLYVWKAEVLVLSHFIVLGSQTNEPGWHLLLRALTNPFTQWSAPRK